jgi:hypothetical protein
MTMTISGYGMELNELVTVMVIWWGQSYFPIMMVMVAMIM